ncbi:MAG: hypothetical protein E6G07_07735 [Actinobacteria bacterium]|nr:MAG: hypothetical protein E6G07_07735 [Actinomycetota bacterium]
MRTGNLGKAPAAVALPPGSALRTTVPGRPEDVFFFFFLFRFFFALVFFDVALWCAEPAPAPPACETGDPDGRSFWAW